MRASMERKGHLWEGGIANCKMKIANWRIDLGEAAGDVW
jgi:hypothetical protein